MSHSVRVGLAKTAAQAERSSDGWWARLSTATWAPLAMLLALVVANAALYAYLALQKHATFHSTTYDLGIFDQTIWNTAHGRLFESTLSLVGNGNYLGDHFSPILVLFAPLYWLGNGLPLLLVVQSAVVAGAAIPMWLYVRDRLGSAWLATGVAAAFMVYPNSTYLPFFSFHPDVLLLPLLPLAFWFATRSRWLPFGAAVVAMLLIKEEVGLTIAGLGLFLLVSGRRRPGLACVAVGVVWFAVMVTAVIPQFRGTPYGYAERYRNFGRSTDEIARNIVTRPLATAYALTLAHTSYVADLLEPTAYLAVLSPAHLLVAAPTVAGNLLSSYPSQRQIGFHYSIVAGVAVFIAATETIRRSSRWVFGGSQRSPGAECWRLQGVLVLLVLIATGFSTVATNGFRSGLRAGDFSPDRRYTAAQEAIARIPADASVRVSNQLGPQVSQRRYVYQFPPPTTGTGAGEIQEDYVLVDLTGNVSAWRPAIERLVSSGRYERLVDRDRIVLLQKR